MGNTDRGASGAHGSISGCLPRRRPYPFLQARESALPCLTTRGSGCSKRSSTAGFHGERRATNIHHESDIQLPSPLVESDLYPGRLRSAEPHYTNTYHSIAPEAPRADPATPMRACRSLPPYHSPTLRTLSNADAPLSATT